MNRTALKRKTTSSQTAARLHPHVRARDPRSHPAQVDPGRHRGEHARERRAPPPADRPRSPEKSEIVISTGGSSSLARTLGDQEAGEQADRDAARHRDDELDRGVEEREGAADGGRHRDPVEDQRAGVVDEALALDDRHPAAGERRAAARSRSPRPGRWGRRSPRARTPPPTAGRRSACARRSATTQVVRIDQPDRRQRDRAGVGAQLAEVREERRRRRGAAGGR